uniref:Cystatin domain-containing protein n=1 Tax=Globisporangium ultimum (strain ATCC 200006 / CBS 805.95 / DAOM BR144) TaxID=431595 RepID=K3X6G8_GLOUD
MMRTMLCFAAALSLLTPKATAAMQTGGWAKADVTETNTKILLGAMTGGAGAYGDAVKNTRVCFTKVTDVEQQVVAGMNYRFHIAGCTVSATKLAGDCAAHSETKCVNPKEYIVEVFEQNWTSTLQVTAITDAAGKAVGATLSGEVAAESDANAAVKAAPVDETQTEGERRDKDNANESDDDEDNSSSSASAPMSAEEKAQVDAWIKKNDLNQFGDSKHMAYTGGTPLFDETTGKTRDLYDYILHRHPDRPWKSIEVVEAQVNMDAVAVSFQQKDASATASADAVGGRAHDLMSVVVSVGVLTVLIALVAGVKAKRSRHRFTYDSIRTREF